MRRYCCTLWLIVELICSLIISTDSTIFDNNAGFLNPLTPARVIKFGPNATDIVRGRPTTDVVLPCRVIEKNETTLFEQIFWHYQGAENILIGSFNVNISQVELNWTRNGSYTIVKDSAGLLLKDVSRELVERYECIAVDRTGRNLSDYIYFRLDYSFWYALEWNSLFVGSCLSAFIFCAASFVLNIIWIVCRKTILWWLNRAERMQRVQSMVEAMEKYRQKQMENLHETYNRRVAAVRDNYHQQVEQIRASYANQADRFRDYRQEKKIQMENIRENYNQQMSRIREFGSRRAEQLWESYERQLNRMRMFTLERRLKLMRQYKVKQRYINKLLESIGDGTNTETINKQEAAIRAVLSDLPNPSFPQTTISRSSSYYSLPEFVMEEELGDAVGSRDDSNTASGSSRFAKSGSAQTSRNVISKNMHHFNERSQRINMEWPSSSVKDNSM